MNKIFKVVWSKTKECYVVVSEVAKNNGGKKKVLATVFAALVATGSMLPDYVDAANNTSGGGVSSADASIAIGSGWGNSAYANTNFSIAIGDQSNANGKAAIALGRQAKTNGEEAAIAIGNQTEATSKDSTAVGSGSKSSGEYAAALGFQTKATANYATAIGSGARGYAEDSQAIGREAETSAGAFRAIAIGTLSKSSANYATSLGSSAEASAERAIAVGYKSKAKAESAISVGNLASADNTDSIAVGNGSAATANYAVAVGSGSAVSGLNGTAVGKNSQATGQSAAAFGDSAQATNAQATAIGNQAVASDTRTTAIGNQAKATGPNATVVGSVSEGTGPGATAIGTNNKAGYESAAVGLSNTVSGNTSAAFGRSNTVTGKESLAAGVRSTAAGEHNVAIGYQAATDGKATVAIGEGSKADIADGVALGSNSATTAAAGVQGFNPADSRTNTYSGLTGTAQTSTLGAVAVGNGATATRQITGLAAGKEDTDAVNVAQLRSVNLKYAGNSGDSDVRLENGTLNIKGKDLISTTANASGITVELTKGADIANDNGKAKEPTTNGVATTQNVVQAINNSYWKATAGGNTDGTPSVGNVKPGTQVTYSAGDNLKVKQTIAANGDQEYKYSLNADLKGINSISNTTTGPTMTFGSNSINITGGSLNMGNSKITNLAPGTDDKDAVNYSQIKGLRTEVVQGTGVTVAKTQGADGHDIYTVSANATGGTASTESVVKKAAASGDTNIADISVADNKNTGDAGAKYEVSVSRNAVKDAAREAVTVNNGGTTTGGTYTADTNNPISVTATPDNTNHNTTYEVTFDGNKAAKQIPLTYKATNGTTTTADQTVKLDKGLNFTGGDYTTASVGADGKVTFDVTLGTVPTVTDGKPGVPGQAGAAGKDGIATVKTVVDTINNSGWKANAKANGGKLDGNSTATVVKPGDQVNFAAGKNLTVKQDLTGEHTYTYSLNKDLKDLTSVEIGGSTIKTDGDHITITSPDTNPGATPGATVTNKVANLGDEKHIKPDTYAVANDGSVTLKYVDGNSKELTETTKITGITNQNLSNISTDGETKIKNLAKSAINMEDGKNTKASKRDVNGVDTYKVDVEGDLTGISSITNGGTNNGKISFGPNKTVTVDGDHSITLNASTGKIGGLQNKTFDPTNFTSGQAATEDQLKSVHDTLKANELHIAPTETNRTGEYTAGGATGNTASGAATNAYKYDATTKQVVLEYNDGTGANKTGTKAVIDFSALNTGAGASSWNIASDKVSTTEGTVAAGSGATQNIADGKTVTMKAGKNLTVKQENVGGNASVAFSLDKDLKDLDSVTTNKTITKEITLKDPNGGTTSTTIKKDGDRITYTNDGSTTVNKVANLADEKHITPGTYSVDSTGKVTMTYTDGNGGLVPNTTTVIDGLVTKKLDNIDNDGKKTITGLGTIVKAGDNVTVSEASDATTGQKTYTVNAVTPAVYTKADGTKVVKRSDGTYTTNIDGSSGNDVPASDVIISFQDAAGDTKNATSIVNNVGSAIDKNGTSTGDTFLSNLNTAATNTPNAAVNVRDLKTTSDALIDKGLRFDANEGNEKTNKLGSKVTVQGTGAVSTGKQFTDEYNTANIRTNISQNNGDTVINVGLAKALKNINSISNGGSSITLNSTPGGATNTPAVQITGGNLSMGDGTTNNKIVNLAPGTADTDAVNVKQLKDTELHITPGTYTPGTDKKVKLTYTDGNNTVVNGKEAVIDLSGLATGGTTSTEKVQKAADATDDKNIAEVGPKSGDTFGAANATYEVSVSRNAVKDAAREAVTINNGGTKSGTTYTPNADNPITVTPKEDAANHNTTYEVTFDGNKAAKQIPLTYKATNGTTTTADQTVKLDKGLNFTGGDYTTASVGADGKVTFDVTLGTTPTVTDGKPGVPGQAGAAGKDGIATVKTVVDTINNSGWKANAKANGGTLDGSSTATVVKPGDQVNFAAGKNLTVKQDLTGEHTYTYSLNKDLKDLTSVEIGGSTIKTDGDHITITSPDTTTGATPGATVTNKVANLGDEKHIKPDTYAVATDGSVTLKYVDGNGKDLTETTKITGITNQNLSNISTDGETKIKNLAKSAINMEDGKNTKASKRDVNGVDTYKVDVEGDLTGISSITNDGTNNGKISFGPNKTVTVEGDHSITLNASTGKIGGLQNKTFDPTNITSGQAATEDQLKSVHNTLKASELHIAPTAVKTGSTENKGGTANAGGTANVYKYDAASKTVTLTYNDGNGNAVTDTKAVIDLSNLSTGGTGASSWNVKSSANTTDGGAVDANHNANAQNIADGKSVEFQSGKNLVVKQTNDTANGNATVEFSLSDKITVGKDGANGKDGSVGAKGADGSAVVMNGKDGSIGLNGTNGANGISIKGKDGANGVGIDGKDGVTRIVYTEKVPDPANPSTTKEVTHEVATMDDGLKFTGNNTGTVNKHKLGSLVKVQGEGVSAADEAAFVSASGNIAVTAENNDTLTIRLNKNLKGLNSIQLGGNTIQSNGDNITFTTNGGTTKTVATTDQLWTIQANGTDVPATNGKVNVVGKDGITVAKNAAGNLEISGAGLGTMNGFDVTANNGATSKTIDNGKKVDFNAGSNLTVKQTNDATGTHIEYALKEAVDLGTNGSLKAGDTTVNKDGVTIANGPSITKTGVDAGDKKITNVADGAVNATSKDAVNGSQLKKYTDAAKTTVEAGDNNVKVETDNSAADGHTNYKVSLEPVVTIGDTHKVKIDGHTGDITGLTNVTLTDPTFATKGRAATEEQLDKVLTEAKKKAVEKVQAGTAAAGDTNIATVTPKAGDTFGAAGATYEVSVSKNAVKDAAKEAVKVTSVSPAITVTPDTSVAHETTYKVGFDGAEAAKSIPLTYKANGNGTQTVTLDKGLDFKNGTNTTARIAPNGQVFYDVNPNLQNISSISGSTTGNGPRISFNNAGANSTVNIDGGNLNMNNNKITHVANGTDDNDAVNVSQLKAAKTVVKDDGVTTKVTKSIGANGEDVYTVKSLTGGGADLSNITNKVDQLGEEIGRVGAQGAALSALKPIQYDPLEPTQIMAGYGNYRGNSAVALGVAHYKNESTLIHGGVSWAGGSSHMMANAGVTWKVGNRDSEAAVADRYRKGPISSAYAMQQEMAAMKAQNAGLKGEVSDLKAENEQMKAQIAAMMAKLGL
ncbi:ESPR-type extended signal peptide-containing protein [Veillonella atypica]|uniref:ESPR-type extended signal peptide-containing protein n=1 Tax=Veillonella atypica TaxID=39777 RepID=UPI0022E41493|nr:ESPR-type extended signal peptide-containing protein [Veillonella atypica]